MMPDNIIHRRGIKANMPRLTVAELGLSRDTEQVFMGGDNRNIPLLTLEADPGGPLGIDTEATENSVNLITSDAVYKAMQNSGVNFTTDETLTLSADGVLSVNTANVVEADNTLPVTSAAVQITVGNIDALLKTI